MTVIALEYNQDKQEFFQKHNSEFQSSTSPMDEYGRYSKTYVFEDGATWYESMYPTYEKGIAEIKGVKVEVEVKLFATEYWSTDNSSSKVYYNKF